MPLSTVHADFFQLLSRIPLNRVQLQPQRLVTTISLRVWRIDFVKMR